VTVHQRSRPVERLLTVGRCVAHQLSDRKNVPVAQQWRNGVTRHQGEKARARRLEGGEKAGEKKTLETLDSAWPHLILTRHG
jgi:hypothetical protein